MESMYFFVLMNSIEICI